MTLIHILYDFSLKKISEMKCILSSVWFSCQSLWSIYNSKKQSKSAQYCLQASAF